MILKATRKKSKKTIEIIINGQKINQVIIKCTQFRNSLGKIVFIRLQQKYRK